MRDFSKLKSQKKPNLDQEITLYCTNPKENTPRIRITAERYRIEKNNQILSYYRIYYNERLMDGTYNLDKVSSLLADARKFFRFQKKNDNEIEETIGSTRRIKFAASEKI